jgi:hypothetical protein
MSERSNTDEQAGMDAGEGRLANRQGEDDVEGHRYMSKRDEGLPTDEGNGLRGIARSDDDEPDVEAHKWRSH